MLRIHAEDFCQALGVPPERKYENEGGPASSAIADLLRNTSVAVDADVSLFAEALMFNWLIAGSDAHAKNYSMLLGVSGHVRLAPLYDIASVLAYEHIDPYGVKLAMRVGRHYRLRVIQARHWRETARVLRLPEESFMTRLDGMAAAFPDAIADTARAVAKEGLKHANLTRLQEELQRRIVECAEVLIAS